MRGLIAVVAIALVVLCHMPKNVEALNNASWPVGGVIKGIYLDVNYDKNDITVTLRSIVDSDYNLVLLAFFQSLTPYDSVLAWSNLTPDQQQATIAYFHSKNARLVVSAGGANDVPYNNFNGTEYGTAAANFAAANFLDGVDLDLENFKGGFTYPPSLNTTELGVGWVVNATLAVRSVLGPTAWISHAPQPPYFGTQYSYWSNGYSQVYLAAPTIDYFLVQFFNNGPTNGYQSIFVTNQGEAILEIVTYGVPLNKIVVGKSVLLSDADTSSYMNASAINALVVQANTSANWSVGVFGWAWHDNTTNKVWIDTIYPPPVTGTSSSSSSSSSGSPVVSSSTSGTSGGVNGTTTGNSSDATVVDFSVAVVIAVMALAMW